MSGPCFFKEFFDEIVSKRGGNPKKNLHSFPLSLIKRIGGSACNQLDKPWPRSFRSLPQLFCRMSAYDCFMYIYVTFGFTWISILTSESLFISVRWPAKGGKFFDIIEDRSRFFVFLHESFVWCNLTGGQYSMLLKLCHIQSFDVVFLTSINPSPLLSLFS